jgi:CBS domain-containing protein
VRDLLTTHRHERFPVVVDGRLVGVIGRHATEAALAAGRLPQPELAAICTAKTTLREIQTRIIESPSQFAVVVDQEGPECRVVGLLTLHDILRAEMLFAREQEE